MTHEERAKSILNNRLTKHLAESQGTYRLLAEDIASALASSEKNGREEAPILPECPMCGKIVALICPDDLVKLQDAKKFYWNQAIEEIAKTICPFCREGLPKVGFKHKKRDDGFFMCRASQLEKLKK